MLHAARRFAAACLIAVPLAGCANESQQTAPPEEPPPTVEAMPLDRVQRIEILGKVIGDLPLGMEGTVARLTEAQFEEAQMAREGFTPDFARHDVIVVSLGEQPTGGYVADITALQRVGDTVYVEAVASAPGPAEEVTQAVTHPFSAVIVDKLPADITLRSDMTSQR